MKISKKNFVLICIAFFLLLAGACLVDFFSFDRLHYQGRWRIPSNNGLWLRYFWYLAKYKPAEFDQMIDRLNKHRIAYAYFHVLNSKSDGQLRYREKDNALKITKAVRERAPACKSIAWVYVPSFGKDATDLSNKAVRAKLVEQASWLIDQCGFDGIQWDYEFCTNKNPGFLALMKETRAALPGKFISLASPMWYPGVLWGWEKSYFADLAPYADQLAVMGYDSYFYSTSAYAWLISQQLIEISDALKNSKCKLIIGVPSYEDKTLAHICQIESLSHALTAVHEALLDPKKVKERYDGVAIFADYTTDENEWNEFDEHVEAR